jgi:hypothetical protein
MSNSPPDLDRAAYDVADDYRSGRLARLADREWQVTWHDLKRELERRCPGFKDDEYSRALDRGFVESR